MMGPMMSRLCLPTLDRRSATVRSAGLNRRATIAGMSEADKSPLGSQLTVRIGRNGQGSTIHSGPLDCPELRHANSRQQDAAFQKGTAKETE